MRRASVRFTLILALVLALAGVSLATAQVNDGEWEYLIVSYGTTSFTNVLGSPDADNVTFSKVQLFSEIGVTLPSEAITLQRNIDVLGMFGWEMVTIVGTIGGDQQIVFKRPYDAERSQQEAERIRAERERLIEAYNLARTSADPQPQLVDLDEVDLLRAKEAREREDAVTVSNAIRTASSDFKVADLEVSGYVSDPEGMGVVEARLTLDVTDAALVAAGQYRSSLVEEAVTSFTDALGPAGLIVANQDLCFRGPNKNTALITIVAVIEHDGNEVEVGSFRRTRCY